MYDFKLDTEPKINSGFIIPDNYFESLTTKLQPKLVDNSSKVISLRSYILKNKSWFTSAAAIVLISISSIVYVYFQNQNNQKYTAELESYITNHNSYSDDEIVNLLEITEIESIKFNSKLNSKTLENQLLNNVDLEEIITN